MGLIKDRIPTYDNIKNASFGLSDTRLLELLGLSENSINSEKLGETVFFSCLGFLSNAISKLPIYKYSYDNTKGRKRIIDTAFDNVFNLEPNEYMSASTFWSCVELNRNFFGNAYVFENISKGKLNSLWILPSEDVTVYRDNAGIFGKTNAIWYVWFDRNDSGKRYTFAHNEILHYKTWTTWDGVMGIPVKDILKIQIETQKYGQSYINNLYKNNMFGDKVILQYTGDLSPTLKDSLVKETERYCNTNGTRFLPMPMNVTATPMSMKLSDAEFSIINSANANLLAAAFGLSPNVINDYSKSSYANSISQQTDFYVNTLNPIITHYKQENTRKTLSSKDKSSGIFLEHDTKAIWKLDPTAQMVFLKDGVNNLMITPNEAREELGYSWVSNGDMLVGNGNLATLDVIKSGANYNRKAGNGGEK